MPTAPKRVPTQADTDRLTRTINDLIAYTGSLNYLPLSGGTLTGDLLFSADNAHDVGAAGATRPRTLYVGTNVIASGAVGIGTVPTVPLHVSKSVVSGFFSILANTNATSGAKGVEITITSTAAGDQILSIESGSTTRYGFYGDGSFLGKGGEAVQKIPVFEHAGADTTLTTTFQNMTPSSSWPSLSIGNWIVTGVFRFLHSNGAGADTLNALTYQGQIACTGGTATIHNSTSLAIKAPQVTGEDIQVSQTWFVSVTAATVVSLQVKKTAGTGASAALQTNSTLTAGYFGNPV